LNQDAIVIRNQEPVEQHDSQRKVRKHVNINDMPFTAVCDWIETCEYTCTPSIPLASLPRDDSTYDEYSARWRIQKMKQFVRERFSEQPFYQSEDLWNLFSMIQAPPMAVVDLLHEIVNQTSFSVQHNGVSGYIRYCNGYYIFQPHRYSDLTIPLAIRVASYPVKRDAYLPVEYHEPAPIEEQKEAPQAARVALPSVWKAMVDWCQGLSSRNGWIVPPYEIRQRIIEISYDNEQVRTMYEKILEVIHFFYDAFDAYHHPRAFQQTLLYYFWDEWFTMEEQIQLLSLPGAHECTQENRISLGQTVIERFMNPVTNQVQMTLENGTPCPAVVVERVQQLSSDPLRTEKRTLAPFFGTVVPKDGRMVFKTNTPSPPGKPPGRGKECINVSNKPYQRIYLLQMGATLLERHGSDCHLNEVTIMESDMMKNSVRSCTIMNLFLRFIDLDRTDTVRWFFRPVEAHYQGYKGTVRASIKK